MCHTNEAAKEARQNMFAIVDKFGLPAIFFTVTPDDSNIFRIKVYAQPDKAHVDTGVNDEAEVIAEMTFRNKP